MDGGIFYIAADTGVAVAALGADAVVQFAGGVQGFAAVGSGCLGLRPFVSAP